VTALRAVADEEALWGWEGRGECYEAALAVTLHDYRRVAGCNCYCLMYIYPVMSMVNDGAEELR